MKAVCAFTRVVAEWTDRFPRIQQAAMKIKADSFLLDGEAIVYDKGHAELRTATLAGLRHDKEVSLCAFDLLELQGTEVRKQPLLERKSLLADLLKNVKEASSSTSISRVLAHDL